MAAAGPTNSLVVDADGKVSVMGTNSHGELGWYLPETTRHVDTMNIYTRTCEELTLHTLTAMGELDVAEPVNMQHVQLVATSQFATACLVSGGTLVVGGAVLNGRTSNGYHHCSRMPFEALPRDLFGLSPVVSVACGGSHMVAVTQNGRVWTGGLACNYGIGHVGARVNAHAFDARCEFRIVDTPKDFLATTIVFVAAGHRHTSCVDSNGSVWLMGDLVSAAFRENLPTMVDPVMFANKPVVMTSGGHDHIAAVTHDGDLYTWGLGRHGQLGIGDLNSSHNPVMLASVTLGDSPVRTVACGSRHTLIATEAGAAWICGSNGDDYSYGAENRKQPCVWPVKVDLDVTIVAVATADTHSVAISADGRLFTWGTGPGTGHHSLDYPGCVIPKHIPTHTQIGRWHRCLQSHALAFAMCTHSRLGKYDELPSDLVEKIVRLCVWRPQVPEFELEGMM